MKHVLLLSMLKTVVLLNISVNILFFDLTERSKDQRFLETEIFCNINDFTVIFSQPTPNFWTAVYKNTFTFMSSLKHRVNNSISYISFQGLVVLTKPTLSAFFSAYSEQPAFCFPVASTSFWKKMGNIFIQHFNLRLMAEPLESLLNKASRY